MTFIKRIAVSLFGLLLAAPALAQDGYLMGQPTPWGLGPQPGVTPLKEQLLSFHNMLLILITLITLFVLGLLVYVMLRFNAKRNPVPSKTSHNTTIEIIWTVVPVIILVIVAIPSFKLLYAQDVIPESDITVKVIGKQWYWTYEVEHPEKGVFQFDSYMLTDEEAAAQGKPRLLGVDNPVVIPVDATVRFQITASDVLHAFTVPAFGVKVDAVTGRLNETWARPGQTGVFYGQCSELCGTNHAYMPIEVHVVSQGEFEVWLDKMADEYAGLGAPAEETSVQLANWQQ